MNERRHIKIVCISAPTFERLVREGVTVRCVRGVPVDAKLVGMGPDILRDGFSIAFEHPSFPPVDLGTMLPIDWAVFEELSI